MRASVAVLMGGWSAEREVSLSSGKECAAVVPASAGRYQLLAEIGRGGMGAVWRAHDPDLNRSLAIKLLLTSHQEHPAAGRRRRGDRFTRRRTWIHVGRQGNLFRIEQPGRACWDLEDRRRRAQSGPRGVWRGRRLPGCDA